MDDHKEKLEALVREKEQMIRKYLSLQDRVDAINEEIYHVCCGVEGLNLQITLLREQLRKAALKAPPVNGKAHP